MIEKLDALSPSVNKTSRPRLRILQVVPSYYPAVRYGGPIRSVHSLSQALVERGHEVQVFTSSMDGAHDLDVPENVPVHLDGVRVRYFRVPFLRRLCVSPSMQRVLRDEIHRFDLLHLHSSYLWFTAAAARVANQARVPFIVSPRGMLGATVVRRKNRLIKLAWIRLFERRNLIDSAAVHVTSEFEEAELRALGLSVPRFWRVPNGVSWPRRHLSLPECQFPELPRSYALFLGRISWKKGLDRLIRAWRLVPDLSLVIAGNDDEDYLPKMMTLARSEGVADRLTVLGPVSDEQKWSLYENAMMFLLPSYSENFANTVAESMSMGCPVIVTPEVGLATMVRESGAGLVCSGEPRALAHSINELRTNEVARRRCGAAGRRTAEGRLSWSAVAAEMEQLYLSSIA
jgi:glycosyltransferase involved in cell wall biosynthesis